MASNVRRFPQVPITAFIAHHTPTKLLIKGGITLGKHSSGGLDISTQILRISKASIADEHVKFLPISSIISLSARFYDRHQSHHRFQPQVVNVFSKKNPAIYLGSLCHLFSDPIASELSGKLIASLNLLSHFFYMLRKNRQQKLPFLND
jgi:hypothetical protein